MEGNGRIIMEISRIEGQNDLLKLLQALDAIEADEKGDGSEDAEAAVDETPSERNAQDRAGDDGEGNDRDAGDDAELEDPLVADGSRSGPRNAMASTKCAKASQSVP
jgi:hypothetical protein